MIYLDSSVALSMILAEKRQPPREFWQQPIASSRLLEYEVWNRVHAYGIDERWHGVAHRLLAQIVLTDMSRQVLARALVPFAVPVRTLDGLHLATMHYFAGRGVPILLASYDARLLSAAQASGFATVEP